MLYVGLDIHTKHVSACILNKNGKELQRWKVRQKDQLMDRLQKLSDRFAVCFEASCGYGFWHDLLCSVADRVVVAHPGLLKLIFRSKQKNDRRDAERLAKLLFLDEVPAVHVPAPQIRAWRELITFRRKMIQKRTRAKNGVRALLRGNGIKSPSKPGLWTKKGMVWLKQLEFSQSMHTLKRDLLVEEIETLSTQVKRVEQELKQFSQDNITFWQLQSIPGVGPRTAEAMVAFIDDPHRFRNSKSIGAYFGLVPAQDQSGDSNRMGRITREGSATVRQLLVEATWQAVRRSPTIAAHRQHMQRNDPERRKKAVVATAHYLARVMWAMMKHGTLWKEKIQKA